MTNFRYSGLITDHHLPLTWKILANLRYIFHQTGYVISGPYFIVPLTLHCAKSAHIRSYSAPYFSAFGLNMERYGVSFRIQSLRGKIRTRKIPNTDTFHVVLCCIIQSTLSIFSPLWRGLLLVLSKFEKEQDLVFTGSDANSFSQMKFKIRWLCFYWLIQ